MKRGSFRSLFPREEYFFIITRIITVLVLLAWIIFAGKPEGFLPIFSWVILSLFFLHLAVFSLIRKKSSIAIATLYRLTFWLDIVFISFLIHASGGIHSSFFVFYYLPISFSAYYMGLQTGIILAFISSICYVLAILPQLSAPLLPELPVRLSVGWFFALSIGVFSKHFKHSGSKLLHLLDTLNERTTELERTQIQLETIYETSRSLGEIHNLDEVFVEVNNIADNILGYQMCSILLLDNEKQNLELAAKVINGTKKIFKNPQKISIKGVSGRAVETGRVVRISDLTTMNNYIPGLEDAKSEMAAPMIARGKIVGVLNAESTKLAAFSERDEKLFTILAASAGMAIENARLHKRISDLTMTDDLTGIYNYRYFVQRLEEEKRRAARYDLPLSLIMLDLDWFKKTNDTYGHEIGNIVLKEIVQVVVSCIRDTDTFCRYGGEEFIIILPQTISSEACVLAERIRAEVENHDFGIATGIPGLKITVSVGTTSFPDNGLSTMELVQTVDMALYRAKGAGKNMVCTV
ncbi:MAG: sensor domain-containing diguanylate cyclase [candidate division Zixibacteria bacterium]|nr:sensor domain-containing diguanylate cyclase [candidate division Zixibacteria bacterium]NIR67080.1 sensor domain-containing diguanylate cyclase [candidate division Zixibacteria bacterium]NIS15736.1 sensor domain-containing diguanylate cyclase [candidate division Zixibacteria bacterium]NIS48492.1 sensor domain-containing diguanylate cyclase [candidate division Zixibacteria bacterium]NIT52219.1 sensor domain-containing diguanylate cyclase [candidate division Zixibacteria bacterium]